MEALFNTNEKELIEAGISEKYRKVATNPSGLFQYPTGQPGLEALNYDQTLIRQLPESVASSFCGVGNPFALGPLNKGERILDIGCGAGVDTILAGMMVGPSGKAAGIDMIPEMLDRARGNVQKVGLMNVIFERASAEEIPFSDGAFDVVISNGVLNLVPDKRGALKEIFRVLKPSGRLMMADQVLTVFPERDRKTMVAQWSQ